MARGKREKRRQMRAWRYRMDWAETSSEDCTCCEHHQGMAAGWHSSDCAVRRAALAASPALHG